jgi:hypothetical protein
MPPPKKMKPSASRAARSNATSPGSRPSYVLPWRTNSQESDKADNHYDELEPGRLFTHGQLNDPHYRGSALLPDSSP